MAKIFKLVHKKRKPIVDILLIAAIVAGIFIVFGVAYHFLPSPWRSDRY